MGQQTQAISVSVASPVQSNSTQAIVLGSAVRGKEGRGGGASAAAVIGHNFLSSQCRILQAKMHIGWVVAISPQAAWAKYTAQRYISLPCFPFFTAQQPKHYRFHCNPLATDMSKFMSDCVLMCTRLRWCVLCCAEDKGVMLSASGGGLPAQQAGLDTPEFPHNAGAKEQASS